MQKTVEVTYSWQDRLIDYVQSDFGPVGIAVIIGIAVVIIGLKVLK